MRCAIYRLFNLFMGFAISLTAGSTTYAGQLTSTQSFLKPQSTFISAPLQIAALTDSNQSSEHKAAEKKLAKAEKKAKKADAEAQKLKSLADVAARNAAIAARDALKAKDKLDDAQKQANKQQAYLDSIPAKNLKDRAKARGVLAIKKKELRQARRQHASAVVESEALAKSATKAKAAYEVALKAKRLANDGLNKAQNLAAALKAGAKNVAENLSCNARADRNGCPFMGPGDNVELFSRCYGPVGAVTRDPTIIGNIACDSVLGIQELAKKLDGARDEARRRIDERIDARLNILTPKFIASLNEVREIGDDIKQDFVNFTNDPECGKEDSYDHMKKFFADKVDNAEAFAALTAKRVQGMNERRLAIAEARDAYSAARELSRKYPSNVAAARVAATVGDFKRSALGLQKGGASTSFSGSTSSDMSAGYDVAARNNNPGGTGNCGALGEPKCRPGGCDSGLTYDDSSKTCQVPPLICGALGQPQCTPGGCNEGLVYDDTNQLCLIPAPVEPPVDEACGGIGQPGCGNAANACNSGLTFEGGRQRPGQRGNNMCTSNPIYPVLVSGGICAAGLIGTGIAISQVGAGGVSTIAGAAGGAFSAGTGIGALAGAAWAGLSATYTAIGAAVGTFGAAVSVVSCGTTVVMVYRSWDAYTIRWHEIFHDQDHSTTPPRDLSPPPSPDRNSVQQVSSESNNMPTQARSDMNAIKTAMDRSIGHQEAWLSIHNEVNSLRSQLGENRYAVFKENVDKLVSCSTKVANLAKGIGGNVGEGVREITDVLVDLEALGNSIDNIKQAGEDARQAAHDRAEARINVFRTAAGDLYQKLLGVSYGQPASAAITGQQLAKQAKNRKIKGLKKRLTELQKVVDNLADEAVSNLDARLEGLEERIADARDKAESIRPRLESGLKKLRQYRTNKVVAVN